MGDGSDHDPAWIELTLSLRDSGSNAQDAAFCPSLLPGFIWIYKLAGGYNGGYGDFLAKKKGLRIASKSPLLLVVAGAGFEPTTFGL